MVFSLAASRDEGVPEIVRVQSAEGEFLYPLNESRLVRVNGPLGTTEVEIDDGRVRVTEDPGYRQICVLQGGITRAGDWLACLPNQVFIRIEGRADRDLIDAQTY
ncbi:MAG: hypothetical protein EA426_03575 [Spirochaetaceae bacterium]|nr:MAG: hypothetical protein EA426_03575 [Spirochaetaceae bacterium]